MRHRLMIWKTLNEIVVFSKFPTTQTRCLSTDCSKKILSYYSFKTETKLQFRSTSRWTPNVRDAPLMNYPIPAGSLIENIWSRFDKWADKVALVCGVTGREIKYKELWQQSNRIAVSLLTELGLSPGDVIAIILPNIPEYSPMLLGAWEAGLVVTTINPLYTAEEIASQLEDSAAVVTVTFPDKLPVLLEAITRLNKQNELKVILTPNPDGNTVKNSLNDDQIHQYSDLVSNSVDIGPLDSLKPKTRSQSDIIYVPFSSGTSGKPKGVCLTNRNLLANNTNMRYVRDVWETTSTHQDVVPMVLPTFHVYGLTVNLINSLYAGAKIITLPKFEEATFLKAIKDQKASVLYIAPPLVLYIAMSPSVNKEHLKSLRTVVSGAAPLSRNDIEKCLKKMPANINFKQGYGLTETSPAVCFFPENIKPPNAETVGFPMPNTQIKVLDLQTRQALGANDEGEICVRGPQVMKGYLNNAKATEECIDKEGWFHTGDVGYYDKSGYFYITDRVKELIKVKGFQVAPSELEAILRDHPDVEDAGVIGIPHSQYGEVPVAFVYSKQSDVERLEQSLKKYLSEKVASYKHVGQYIFVDSIPKSAAGKILRKDLKTLYFNISGK